MTGERFDANEVDRLVLLNWVFAATDFADEVNAFARRLVNGPRPTLEVIKRCVYLGASGSVAEVLGFEAREQAALFLSEDAHEGIRAFMEKRQAAFGLTPITNVR